MKANINKVKNMLKTPSAGPKDRFAAVMEPFYNSAAEKAAEMHSKTVEAQKSTDELMSISFDLGDFCFLEIYGDFAVLSIFYFSSNWPFLTLFLSL